MHYSSTLGETYFSIKAHRHCITLMVLCWLLGACASIPSSKPLAPQVEIASIEALKLGLKDQLIAFRLKVNNPNDYDLPLRTLNFIAAIDGTELAHGVTRERVTLPANGQTMVDVQVKTRVNKLIKQLLLSKKISEQTIPYDVKGFVRLGNWPSRLPFKLNGTVDNPATR